MRILKWTAGAVLVCASLGSASVAANAASLSDCTRMNRDVKTALAANTDSAKGQDARQQQRYGVEYCNAGLYDRGVAHYTEALQLLGADKKS